MARRVASLRWVCRSNRPTSPTRSVNRRAPSRSGFRETHKSVYASSDTNPPESPLFPSEPRCVEGGPDLPRKVGGLSLSEVRRHFGKGLGGLPSLRWGGPVGPARSGAGTAPAACARSCELFALGLLGLALASRRRRTRRDWIRPVLGVIPSRASGDGVAAIRDRRPGAQERRRRRRAGAASGKAG